jgi:predicted  nucleic acid-binding Zn-ribbon protein
MKKAIEIKSEIDKTDSRITELENELTAQTASFEATQKAFIDGKADSANLHSEQSKQTLIEQAIESLRATYQRLKAAFSEQSAVEQRTELLKQMATTANEVPSLVDEYLETRTEFHELVSKYAEELIGKAEAYRKKQIEYRAIVAELQPTDEEIAQCGLEQKTRTMAATTYFNHPPIEYGEAIQVTENILAAKLNKAAEAKRRAEFNLLAAARR